MMKLIGSLTSPYVRKARIVLVEKQINYDFEVDVPWNAQTQVSNHNPLGKIPILVLDEKVFLYDSRVIAEYIDSLATQSEMIRLIPGSGDARWQVKRWEALADGICDAAATIFLERKRPPSQQSEEWIARQQKKIDLGLSEAANELGDKAWCVGEAISLADIALGCALGYLAFRFPQIEWPRSYPNLNRLAEKLAQRASFIATAPRD